MIQKISREYVLGFISRRGCLTFHSRKWRSGTKHNIPAFVLEMRERDLDLINQIKGALHLQNKVHIYGSRTEKVGSNRVGAAILTIRDIGQLKNVIIPLFCDIPDTSRTLQFDGWMERIGNDPLVPKKYKILYLLYKNGYYKNGAHD